MAGLSVVREELVSVIKAGTDLQVYNLEPDSVSVPCVIVRPSTPFVTYQQRMGRSAIALWHLDVLVLAGRVAESSGQRTLDELVSPDGPLVSSILRSRIAGTSPQVIEGTVYGEVTVGRGSYLGAQLQVDILA